MMLTLRKTAAPHRARHLVFGSGGTRAFLNGAGAIYACHLAGVTNWATVGGVSGGSIPALLAAAGIPPREIVRHSVNTDFTELLKQTDTITLRSVTRRLFGKATPRLRDGIVSSAGLGDHLEQVVQGRWPEKFWTMAVAGKRLYLFTADGVFLYHKGRCRQLTSTPAPIGLAIRASCAVPGIIESIEFLGVSLFDGALTRYGECPTEMASMHFGAKVEDIIAIDLHRRAGTRREQFVEMIARGLSGTLRQRPGSAYVPKGGLVVRTEMEKFHSLDFNLPVERKQSALLAGFRQTCMELSLSGQLSSEDLSLVLAKSQTWEDFEQFIEEREAPVIEEPAPVEPPKRRRRWYYLWLR
jgi:predicted acylesterase/phospholipase RssA